MVRAFEQVILGAFCALMSYGWARMLLLFLLPVLGWFLGLLTKEEMNMGFMRKFRMRSTDSSRKIAVGNFRYAEFVDVVKIHDVGGCFHHDASKQTAVGLLLSEAIGSALEGDEMAKNWLGTYAVITYNVLGCVPDPEYINALMVATEECRSRHKGFYGIKEDISEEEDAEILKDVRETVEMEQELKDAVEKES